MKYHFGKLKRFSLLATSLVLFLIYLPVTMPILTIAVLCSWSGTLFGKNNLKMYGFHLAISYDRFSNIAIFLGASSETISSRLGRATLATQARWWVPGLAKIVDVIALLGFGDNNHVVGSIESGNHEANELVNWIIIP